MDRKFRIAVVAVSVGVASAGSIVLATRDSSESATTRGVTATLRVSGHPGALIAGADALWVALSSDAQKPADDARLLRLDLATEAPSQPVYLGGEATPVAHDGDRLIASVNYPSGLGELVALKWRDGVVLARHWFPAPVDQVVRRGGELWALEGDTGTLVRVDPGTLAPVSPGLRLSLGHTLAMASAGAYLWVTAADAGEVLRIDPATHAIKRATVGGFPIGIVVSAGSVWVADHDGGQIVRLDQRSLLPVGEPIRVGTKPSWLVAAAGSLFVTDEDDGTVARIDLHSGKEVGLRIRVAVPTRHAPAPSVAPAGRSIWVSSFAANTLSRIDTAASSNAGGEITVRITDMNDRHQGDHVTNGGIAGIGRFTTSGAVAESGKVVVYRTVKGALITIRYVTKGTQGTITFVTEVDTDAGTSQWTITSGTRAYKGLHGEGAEHENTSYSVSTLIGSVSR